MTKRASYKEGVSWIAINDDPDSSIAYDIEALSGLISVLLLADLFGKEPEKVAKDIVKLRERIDKELPNSLRRPNYKPKKKKAKEPIKDSWLDAMVNKKL